MKIHILGREGQEIHLDLETWDPEQPATCHVPHLLAAQELLQRTMPRRHLVGRAGHCGGWYGTEDLILPDVLPGSRGAAARLEWSAKGAAYELVTEIPLAIFRRREKT